MKNFLSISKYHNHKIVIGGMKFDSKKEAMRWVELNHLQDAGEITNLRRQVKLTLIPAQREGETITARGIQRPGKVIERECFYVADFVYEQDGQTVVEDVKGMKTDAYILKRKMLLHFYGIRIKEI
ncbi:MAG: DUF1064 domain-containing protein [Lachnospiraceae bacterium]|nr:DUF1064 domain-containing protein [Lachnospiraceae bacterium]